MDTFSTSSGVQAGPPEDASTSRNNRNKKKTKLLSIRLVAFLLLVGASINRIRTVNSSYIQEVVDSVKVSSNPTAATKQPVRTFAPKAVDPKPTNTGRPSDNRRNAKADFEAWTRPYWNQTNNASYIFPSVDYRLRYYM